MNKINLLFVVIALILSANVNAQYELPVTWENEDETDSWTPFENDDDAPENFVIVANPDDSGINTSKNSLMYTVLPTAQPWVGAWSTAYGEIEFTEENHILQMMVYKDVISDCALKVEADGIDFVEVYAANTVTDEWELLSFDFSDAIGSIRTTLVFFPDFPTARTEGSVCYIDNIGWANDGETSVNEISQINVNVYPNPAKDVLTIEHPGMAQIIISNVLGQATKVQSFNATESKSVDVSGLDNGIYFITIATSNGTASTKFLKK